MDTEPVGAWPWLRSASSLTLHRRKGAVLDRGKRLRTG